MSSLCWGGCIPNGNNCWKHRTAGLWGGHCWTAGYACLLHCWPSPAANAPALDTPLMPCALSPTCRRKYKEETTRLNQQLKSASMGSKANDKAADRLQKEVDKLR